MDFGDFEEADNKQKKIEEKGDENLFGDFEEHQEEETQPKETGEMEFTDFEEKEPEKNFSAFDQITPKKAENMEEDTGELDLLGGIGISTPKKVEKIKGERKISEEAYQALDLIDINTGIIGEGSAVNMKIGIQTVEEKSNIEDVKGDTSEIVQGEEEDNFQEFLEAENTQNNDENQVNEQIEEDLFGAFDQIDIQQPQENRDMVVEELTHNGEELTQEVNNGEIEFDLLGGIKDPVVENNHQEKIEEEVSGENEPIQSLDNEENLKLEEGKLEEEEVKDDEEVIFENFEEGGEDMIKKNTKGEEIGNEEFNEFEDFQENQEVQEKNEEKAEIRVNDEIDLFGDFADHIQEEQAKEQVNEMKQGEEDMFEGFEEAEPHQNQEIVEESAMNKVENIGEKIDNEDEEDDQIFEDFEESEPQIEVVVPTLQEVEVIHENSEDEDIFDDFEESAKIEENVIEEKIAPLENESEEVIEEDHQDVQNEEKEPDLFGDFKGEIEGEGVKNNDEEKPQEVILEGEDEDLFGGFEEEKPQQSPLEEGNNALNEGEKTQEGLLEEKNNIMIEEKKPQEVILKGEDDKNNEEDDDLFGGFEEKEVVLKEEDDDLFGGFEEEKPEDDAFEEEIVEKTEPIGNEVEDGEDDEFENFEESPTRERVQAGEDEGDEDLFEEYEEPAEADIEDEEGIKKKENNEDNMEEDLFDKFEETPEPKDSSQEKSKINESAFENTREETQFHMTLGDTMETTFEQSQLQTTIEGAIETEEGNSNEEDLFDEFEDTPAPEPVKKEAIAEVNEEVEGTPESNTTLEPEKENKEDDDEDLFDDFEENLENEKDPVNESKEPQNEEEEDLFDEFEEPPVAESNQKSEKAEEEDLFDEFEEPQEKEDDEDLFDDFEEGEQEEVKEVKPEPVKKKNFPSKKLSLLKKSMTLCKRLTSKKEPVKIRQNTIGVKLEKPEFVIELEKKFLLDEEFFKKISEIDNIAIKCESEKFSEVYIGYFQYLRRCFLKFFLESECCKEFENYIGDFLKKKKKNPIRQLENFDFEGAKGEFMVLLEKINLKEAQSFLEGIKDFGYLFND